MSDTADTPHMLPGRPVEPGSTGWIHSVELPDGSVTPGKNSLDEQWRRIAQFPIPDDLKGKRVLDVGAADGWFSFEMERRGAHVVALEQPGTKILEAKRLLRSRVAVRAGDIAQLTWRELGSFHIILCLDAGRDREQQATVLENICGMARDLVCVETSVSAGHGLVPAAFYSAGFARVRLETRLGDHEHLTCFRSWEPSPATAPAPALICLENNKTRDHTFAGASDDYINFYFKWEGVDLTTTNVFPEISGFGVQPVKMDRSDGGWQGSAKLPPGLCPGWHEFTLRVANSMPSKPVRIGVDIPSEARPYWATEASAQLRIHSVTDGKSFERSRVRVGADGALSAWVQGLPVTADVAEVRLRLNGTDLPATWLEPAGEGARQVNAVLPPGIAAGDARISVVIGSRESVARPVTLHT